MPPPAGIRFAWLFFFAVVTAAAGCFTPPGHRAAPPPPGEYGSALFQLRTGTGTSVRDVRYVLEGPNGFSRAGTFDSSSGAMTATVAVDHVPVGDGYKMTATAMAADGGVGCAGASLPFQVQARGTALVSFRLDCQEAPRTGALSGGGTANLCPLIDGATLSSANPPVGSPIVLVAAAHDADQPPAPLTFTWSATSGELWRPSSTNPTFTCTAPGPVTLTLTVSDGDDTAGCADSLTLTINCGRPIDQIGHVVVIVLENHSFDSLYGQFPGAEGLSSPAAAIPQIDPATGQPYATLPQIDVRVPMDLPNKPFDVTPFFPADMSSIDLVHRFYQEALQIAGGKMDHFVAISDAKGLTVGYYPTATLPMAQLMLANPTESTLCDHFFHAAYGGSFLNHHWLVAAATPFFPTAPPSLLVTLDDAGNLIVDNPVTPDGYIVNLLYPVNSPHPDGQAPETLVPALTNPTIGDRLSEAGVDWAWYAGGWNDAIAGLPPDGFNYHHQPFAYYASLADGTAARAAHLKDETDMRAAIASGTLPPVSFFKPLRDVNEHPGPANLLAGENYTVALVQSLMASPQWNDMVVIVTYDENGGLWDHVPPPAGDRWGPGTRIPTLIFSPFAAGGIDPTTYDTTAILKLIETRWNLAPLTERDATQADLSSHALRLSP